MYQYKHVSIHDFTEIDTLFIKSFTSIVPTFGSSCAIISKWSYKIYLVTYFLNTYYQIILNKYLLFSYCLSVLIFFIASNIYGKYFISKNLPSLKKEIYFKKNNTIIICLDKNTQKIVGFGSIYKQNNNGKGWMHHLYVDPKYQHKGIGKNIIKKIFFEYAINHGYSKVQGGTSSIQYNQVDFMKKYAKIKPFRKYFFLPIHGYYFYWNLNNNPFK